MAATVAILIASVLFALGHLLVDFNGLRMAVFFPALMGIGILASGTLLLADLVRRLMPNRGHRRRYRIAVGTYGVIAATADTMNALIAGRALQGCGAIAGVAMALAADLTRPERRSMIMAVIGIGIGAAIHGYVPEDALADILGKGAWWSVPAGVALGIPLGGPANMVATHPKHGNILSCRPKLTHGEQLAKRITGSS